jgi:hypothetical protein
LFPPDFIELVFNTVENSLSFRRLEAATEGCQANLEWTGSRFPEVHLASNEPLLHVSPSAWVREGVVIEGDYIALGTTV